MANPICHVLPIAPATFPRHAAIARNPELASERSRAKVGEITMDNELLYAKIDKLEGGRPLARRRSKK
ncbi:MAG: hypothetical protein R6V26_16155 [Roseovarius sp.]